MSRRRGPRTLAELLHIELARHGKYSTRHLADETGLSQGTARRLLYAPRKPTEDTLKKLAGFTGWDLPSLRELAEQPRGEPAPFHWPHEFDQLSTAERDVVTAVGWALLRARAGRLRR